MLKIAALGLVLMLVRTLGMPENVTDPSDISALQPLRDMIKQSNLKLDGWLDKKRKDPCGTLNCGVGNNNNDVTEPCAWQGLACLEGRVVGIVIEGSSIGWLGGAIPSTLPNSLRSLQLPNNRLTGELKDASCTPGTPTQCRDRWMELKELEVVDLSFNNITGGLPKWAGLRSLQTVRLKENQLTGQLPNQWKRFRSMRDLDLSHNEIGGELPESWGELPSLESLNLAWNQLSESIPETWVNMVELEKLDLTGNCAICGAIEGRVPEKVFNSGLLAQNTNLRKDCSGCDGCDCDAIPLGLFEHALISCSVLVGILFLVCLRKFWIRMRSNRDSNNQSPAMPGTQLFSNWLPPMPFEKTAVILMPDGKEVCMGKQVEEDKAYESSIDFPDSSTSSEGSSDEEVNEAPITFVPSTAGGWGQQQGIRRRGTSYTRSRCSDTADGSGSENEEYDSNESDIETPSESAGWHESRSASPEFGSSNRRNNVGVRPQSPALMHIVSHNQGQSASPEVRQRSPHPDVHASLRQSHEPNPVHRTSSSFERNGALQGSGTPASLFLSSQRARMSMPPLRSASSRSRRSRGQTRRSPPVPARVSLNADSVGSSPGESPVMFSRVSPEAISRGCPGGLPPFSPEGFQRRSQQDASLGSSPDLSSGSPLPMYVEDVPVLTPEHRRRIVVSRLKGSEGR